MTRTCTRALIIAAFASAAAAAPTVEYTKGHTDLSIDPDAGGVVIAFEHGSGVTFNNQQPDDDVDRLDTVFVRVPDSQAVARPGGTQWDFLGVPAGETVFFLPQSSDPAVPWLGIASESLQTGVWQSLALSFESIDGPDGGELSLWQFGPSSGLVPFVSSADGLPDTIAVPVGGHEHYNWGFSEPGVYRVNLAVVATPASGDPVHDTATLWFAVGSDTVIPSDPADCPGDTDGDSAAGLPDLLTVLGNFGQTTDATRADGDLTGDNAVDLEDLLQILSVFGETCS